MQNTSVGREDEHFIFRGSLTGVSSCSGSSSENTPLESVDDTGNGSVRLKTERLLSNNSLSPVRRTPFKKKRRNVPLPSPQLFHTRSATAGCGERCTSTEVEVARKHAGNSGKSRGGRGSGRDTYLSSVLNSDGSSSLRFCFSFCLMISQKKKKEMMMPGNFHWEESISLMMFDGIPFIQLILEYK